MNVPIDARAHLRPKDSSRIHTRTLRALAERIRPALIVVSAGYDVVAGDPVGDLGVDASFARQMGRLIREIADTYCDGRALFVLEGGYDPRWLATCVADTISGFEENVEVDRDGRARDPARAARARSRGREAALGAIR